MVIADKVVVKKKYSMFSQNKSILGGHLSGSKRTMKKIAVAWVLFYPVLNTCEKKMSICKENENFKKKLISTWELIYGQYVESVSKKNATKKSGGPF